MNFENWLGTLTTVAIMCGAMLALGRWLRTQTADQIAVLKVSMDQQFAVVDQRFAAVDQRFIAVDQRFASIKESMDRMSRENKEEHADIRRSIQEATRQVLGVMDRRFEDTGKRMDEMSKRIDDLRSHVDAAGGRAA